MKKISIIGLMIALALSANVYGAEKRLSELYMEETGEYRYYLDEKNYVTSSQQLGGIVRNVIKLTYNDYTDVKLVKDGEAEEVISGGFIYGNGNYTLTLSNGTDSGSIDFIIKELSAEDMTTEDDSFYTKVMISQSYSEERNMYALSLGNMYTFYSDVPNRSITDKAVKIYAPADERVDINVYKDGRETSFRSGKTFSEPGYYVFSLVYDSADIDDDRYTEEELSGFSDEAMENADIEDGSTYMSIADISIYSFSIIKGPQNRLEFVNPPQDYKISSVMQEGRRQTPEGSFYKLSSDGNYRILFKNPSGILPDCTLDFTRDTKPPRPVFEGVGDGGIAENSFGIIKDDEDTVIEVYKGGLIQNNAPSDITDEGLYRIVAYDSAGNSSAYMINLKKSSKWLLLLIIPPAVGSLLAVRLYSRYVSRNIHIR